MATKKKGSHSKATRALALVMSVLVASSVVTVILTLIIDMLSK